MTDSEVERFFPRPRRTTAGLRGRSVDVVLVRSEGEYAESVPYELWEVLRFFNGATDLRELARVWARTGAGTEAQLLDRLLELAALYHEWFEGGPPAALAVGDLPGTIHQARRYANLIEGTSIPTLPVLGALVVTFSCNLRCRYCFQDHQVHHDEHPPLADLLRILDGFRDLEVPFVRLTGGEPLSHPRFAELAREVAARGLRVSTINTNGTLATPAVVDALREVEPLAVHVSLEAVDRAWADELYGVPGAAAGAMAGVRRLIAAGLRVVVSCTVVAGGAGRLRDLLAWCAGEGVAAFSVRGCRPQAQGRAVRPSAAEEEETIAVLRDFQERVPTLPQRRYWRSHPSRADRPFRCNALTTGAIDVDPQGNVTPCDLFVREPAFTLGNALAEPLRSIWGGPRHRALYEEWYRDPGDDWKHACDTDCPAAALRAGRGPLARWAAGAGVGSAAT